MKDLENTLTSAWNRGGEPALAESAQRLSDSGHSSNAIYQGLEALLLQLRAAGSDDTIEERIMNVMDRVGGWCHESREIAAQATPATPIRAA